MKLLVFTLFTPCSWKDTYIRTFSVSHHMFNTVYITLTFFYLPPELISCTQTDTPWSVLRSIRTACCFESSQCHSILGVSSRLVCFARSHMASVLPSCCLRGDDKAFECLRHSFSLSSLLVFSIHFSLWGTLVSVKLISIFLDQYTARISPLSYMLPPPQRILRQKLYTLYTSHWRSLKTDEVDGAPARSLVQKRWLTMHYNVQRGK